jgi:endopeptidase Clp ATP-binding regulatory subunit ClpX
MVKKTITKELERDINDFADFIREKYGIPGFKATFAVEEELPRKKPGPRNRDRGEKRLRFDLTPKQIKEELDKYVIKQDEAKKILANAAFYHYKHVEENLASPGKREEDYQKNNIIMVGSTGVGKTLLIKHLARILGVPFVKGDATKFSKTGYVGQDVENLVRDLVREADNDIRLAECGIIFIDEIDKIAADKTIIGRDITGTGVQTELLKPMEETEVDLISNTDPWSMMEGFMKFSQGSRRPCINTKNILFIMGGAFPGLAEIIKKRMQQQKIGFGGEIPSRKDIKQFLPLVSTEDFIEYGLLEEFIGRLPVRVVLEDLEVEDFYKILKYSQCSIIRQHQSDFGRIGIKLDFTDDALWLIAQKAYSEKTGARGLMTICEKLLTDFKYELPDHKISNILITREVVEEPAKALERLLILEPIKRFISQFKSATGLDINFTDEALSYISQKVKEGGIDPIKYCWQKLEGCDRLLELSQHSSLTVTPELLENPVKEIATLLTQSGRLVNKDLS